MFPLKLEGTLPMPLYIKFTLIAFNSTTISVGLLETVSSIHKLCACFMAIAQFELDASRAAERVTSL